MNNHFFSNFVYMLRFSFNLHAWLIIKILKNYLNQDILNNIENIINKKQGFQSALIYLVQILLVNLDFVSDTNKTKSP